MKKVKSHMKWSWILMVTFFVLAVLDIRFGILGLVCMIVPLYHAIKGRGKVHCSHYCPRGSFLGRFMSSLSMNNNLPTYLRGKVIKNIILTTMIVVFTITMVKSQGDLMKIGFGVFRLMAVTSILAIIMGVFFKPRSWCQVCPMGYATGLIKNSQDKKDNKLVDKEKVEYRKAA